MNNIYESCKREIEKTYKTLGMRDGWRQNLIYINDWFNKNLISGAEFILLRELNSEIQNKATYK